VTTCIYVENVLGSGHLVRLVEKFGDHSVSRDLQPGENVRVIVSQFKSIWMRELPLVDAALAAPTELRPAETTMPGAVVKARIAGAALRRAGDDAGAWTASAKAASAAVIGFQTGAVK
jgi:hypothetical protein